MKNVAIVVLNLCFLMRFSIVIATFLFFEVVAHVLSLFRYSA